MQYNTIQIQIQYNTDIIQCNTDTVQIQYNTDTIQYSTIQIQIQYNAVQYGLPHDNDKTWQDHL